MNLCNFEIYACNNDLFNYFLNYIDKIKRNSFDGVFFSKFDTIIM